MPFPCLSLGILVLQFSHRRARPIPFPFPEAERLNYNNICDLTAMLPRIFIMLSQSLFYSSQQAWKTPFLSWEESLPQRGVLEARPCFWVMGMLEASDHLPRSPVIAVRSTQGCRSPGRGGRRNTGTMDRRDSADGSSALAGECGDGEVRCLLNFSSVDGRFCSCCRCRC